MPRICARGNIGIASRMMVLKEHQGSTGLYSKLFRKLKNKSPQKNHLQVVAL